PLWSATTCAPYPDDFSAVRTLAIRHLVEPVRFRELVETVYAEGVRVFVQVGTGSVVGFIEDTLRGRPHLAMSANVKERSGLEQLIRLLAALFVEGLDIDASRLAPTPAAHRAPMRLSLGVPLVKLTAPVASERSVVGRPAPCDARGPLAEMFTSTMDAIGRAQADVLGKLTNKPVGTSSHDGPREVRSRRTVSLETLPEVLDHCF